MQVIWCFILCAAGALDPAASPSPVGRAIADFTLRDFRGATFSLAQFKDKPVVVVAFLGTECPLAKAYARRLEELQSQYAAKGVAFLAVNSNQQDSITEIDQQVKECGATYPILKDVGNVVADQFGAVRTPEVFVLDKDRKVRYWGRVDDQFGIGYQRKAPTRRDLAEAVDELLGGAAVSQPSLAGQGCLIGRVKTPKKDGAVTYSRQVARIFQNRCVECHRPGEIAPFALTSYKEAVGWAEMIGEVVREQRMPPWHADPAHGKFSNDARLTPQERSDVEQWIADGAPEGDPKDLPKPVEFASGWRISKPDVVLRMPKPFKVPATGTVQYQYITIDPGFTEDKWISEAECRFGDRTVVHHIIVFVLPPEKRQSAGRAEVFSDFLVASAPGAPPMKLAKGMAKMAPAGSKFVFQMHYTPNGTATEDQSSIGLVFADPKTVKRQAATRSVATQDFVIPPGADNHRVESRHVLASDTLMLEYLPHMHVRGKSFRYTAVYPDGRREILLDVPHYDFNWQNTYTLAEPKRLPRGTTIECVAHFDNSANNPANPDPKSPVRWGDQTWEEMMIGFYNMAVADQDLSQPGKTRTSQFRELASQHKVGMNDDLRLLAKNAARSDADFARLWGALLGVMPQLDRLCLTNVDGTQLAIQFVQQSGNLPPDIAKKDIREIKAISLAFGLFQYAALGKLVVNPDLSKATGLEMRLLSRMLGSSVHVPVRIAGKRGTLNVWSQEPDAFPKEAVQLLEEVGGLITQSTGEKK
jgi:peroxiredoxin/mono/diheme cytochrome c family protein